MEWINKNEKMPTEADEQILVCCEGRVLVEIVYVSDEEQELMKPFRYDEHDTPAFRLKSITHWMPLPTPPSEAEKV